MKKKIKILEVFFKISQKLKNIKKILINHFKIFPFILKSNENSNYFINEKSKIFCFFKKKIKIFSIKY